MSQAAVVPTKNYQMPNFTVKICERGGSGKIVYSEEPNEIQFDYEFGGGNCMLIVYGTKQCDWGARYPWCKERQHEIFATLVRELVNKRLQGCFAEINLASGILHFFTTKKSDDN